MNDEMIQIDGSVGEGGGQMLRTSLTMSAVTGRAFQMVNIRAKRKSPGLKRQHLTCVRAVAEICGAQVTGGSVQSQEITFHPGQIRGGNYRFDIGTAGSITLVAQTILPVLLCANEPSKVVITGGTHVPMSPAWDFFEHTYLPQLRAVGADVTAKLRQHGFYPAGGGEVVIEMQPWKTAIPLQLIDRGAHLETWITAKVASLSLGIAAAEAKRVYEQLPGREIRQMVDTVSSQGPGNYCALNGRFEQIVATFSEIGTYGKSRKAVANMVAQQAKRYLRAAYVADDYLSDQLLVPIMLVGLRLTGSQAPWGSFSLPRKHSLHFDTNWTILQSFCSDCEMIEKPHPYCKYSSILSIGKKGFSQDEMAKE